MCSFLQWAGHLSCLTSLPQNGSLQLYLAKFDCTFGILNCHKWWIDSIKVADQNTTSREQLKRCMDKLSKSTYPFLAPITVFVISGLQSVTYWKNFWHVQWVSYGLYVISCICTLIRAVYWHTRTFSGYINRLCRHTVESYCVSWIYCPIIC